MFPPHFSVDSHRNPHPLPFSTAPAALPVRFGFGRSYCFAESVSVRKSASVMLKLGIVDFDSSHSIEFTRRLNHVGLDAEQYVDGARVMLGCPGNSTMSPERIPGFTKQVAECGVELVDEPQQMLGRIDAVLVLSICGGAHLQRVRPFLKAGVPAFVDKPFACSLSDGEEMLRLAESNNVPLFSSSALRFCAELENFHERSNLYGPLHGAVSYGPAKRAEGNPGLFHYGIHAVEALFTLMGPGCRQVSTVYTEGAEVVTAVWRDGRVATLRGNRAGATTYGYTAFCENAVVQEHLSTRYAYRNLCRQIVRTFETSVPAVDPEVSLEIVRFITAALESEQDGGRPVTLK